MKQSGLTIGIKIQSISDIVTNSSSEVFCTITSDIIKDIYSFLKQLFGECDEYEPTIYYEKDSGEILINLPYGFGGTEFFRKGLETILDKNFENEYNLKYEF